MLLVLCSLALALLLLIFLAVRQRRRRAVDWNHALAVAERYRGGAYESRQLPDTVLAARLFDAIAQRAPDPRVASLARAKRVESEQVVIPLEDRRGAQPIPPDEADLLLVKIAVIRPPARPPVAEGPPIVIGGAQNVHDHGVVSSTAHNLNTLTATQHLTPDSVPDVREPVRHAILSSEDLDARAKEDAIRVLDTISDRPHSNTAMRSELEALRLVWNRSREAPAVKGLLLRQLADSVVEPGGGVVCSTGKIARIVSALDGAEDPSWTPAKPMWAVREELATLAAKSRDEGQDADGFVRRAFDLYVQELGMSEAIVAPLIQDMVQGF